MLVLAALPACGSTRAVGVARVVVAEDAVEFGAVRHAAFHERTVTVTNSGTATARVVVAVTQPFRLGVDALVLDPNTTGTVSVFFLPSDYEGAEGQLTLRVDGRDRGVPVRAAVATDYDEDGAVAEGAGGPDCDDLDPEVFPGQVEVCNGIDDDCDGTTDQGAVDARTFYRDADGDGFGDDDATVNACSAPPGHVAEPGDCDDDDRFFRPGATEFSDGLDQDCDGRVDEHLLTAGALVLTEIHPGLEPDIPAFVELALGDPPAPVYLEGLEVEVDGTVVTLAGTGTGYRSADAPSLVLCGDSAPGTVDDVACVGRLPGGLVGGSHVTLRSEAVLDTVDTDGWRFQAGASLELAPGEDAAGNDDETAWCVSSAPLAGGFGSPGRRAGHCGG